MLKTCDTVASITKVIAVFPYALVFGWGDFSTLCVSPAKNNVFYINERKIFSEKRLIIIDIYIRNIEESYIKIIEERSQELGISRNMYIKKIIQQDAMKNLFEEERNKNREQLKRIADLLEVLTNRTKKLEEINVDIITAISILTDVDIKEVLESK